MSELPKTGMRYSQALKTAIRHKREGSEKIVQSMVNQVRLHEGEKGAREFIKEVNAKGK